MAKKSIKKAVATGAKIYGANVRRRENRAANLFTRLFFGQFGTRETTARRK